MPASLPFDQGHAAPASSLCLDASVICKMLLSGWHLPRCESVRCQWLRGFLLLPLAKIASTAVTDGFWTRMCLPPLAPGQKLPPPRRRHLPGRHLYRRHLRHLLPPPPSPPPPLLPPSLPRSLFPCISGVRLLASLPRHVLPLGYLPMVDES